MNQNPTIKLKRLNPEKDTDVPLPCYMTANSAGMDIFAAVESDYLLEAGAIALIPTGIAMAIPTGFEVQIRPRSGLAAKHGIGLINSPGTIDADYRGEVKIALINLGNADYTIKRGDRIAQMIVNKVYQAEINLAIELDRTDRAAGGFGHTGR